MKEDNQNESKDLKISITPRQIDYINNQIKNSTSKIKYNESQNYFGFFCYFPKFNDNKLLPVLIINNNFLSKEKKGVLSINNNEYITSINLENKRNIYSSEKYNLTIIELKKDDNIKINLFFDIEEDIYEENLDELFRNQSIYILYHSLKEDNIKYSLGTIKGIDEENKTIDYICNNEDKKTFGLLLNLNNFKIIGILNNICSCLLIDSLIDEFDENNGCKNELIIIYKNIKINDLNNNNSKIKLFGDKFVENNKEECKIVINGEERKLESFYDVETLKENELFEIKLIGIRNIIDASYMFFDCTSLYSIKNISEWNTYNIINMSHMFDGCKSLINLPEISNWNTANVNDMSYMFKDCISLTTLPDISKWNKNAVKNISYIFFKSDNSKKSSNKTVNDIKIFKLEEKDIPSIQEIFLSYWGTKGLDFFSEYKRMIGQNMSYCHKIEGELIDFCLLEYNSKEKLVYIDLLCVKKEYSGHHYGKSIFNYCIEKCKQNNFKIFGLHVSTKNKIALKLYEESGFIIKEFIKDFYSDEGPEGNDAYYMILNS